VAQVRTALRDWTPATTPEFAPSFDATFPMQRGSVAQVAKPAQDTQTVTDQTLAECRPFHDHSPLPTEDNTCVETLFISHFGTHHLELMT
jgi:hypothetical protein